MGLLLPAVGAVREASRRNQCSTQIKNLSIAAITYENSKGEMPGYVQSFGRFTGSLDPSDPGNTGVDPHMKIGTWVVALLPSLDAQPAYEHWTEDRYPIINDTGGGLGATSGESGANYHTLAAPNLAVMQCPSNPVSVGEFGKNSYIANTGMTTSGAAPGSFTTPTINFLASQSRANGVFNNKYNVGLVSGKFVHSSEGPKFRLDDLKDGAGNTMLFSENVQALPWHRAGFVDATEFELAAATDTDVVFNATDSDVQAARFLHGMVWHYADEESADTAMSAYWNQNGTGTAEPPSSINTLWKINGGGTTVSQEIFTLAMTTGNSPDLARPSSAHTDGVNAAMGDGGTRFITDNIDYRVYQALLTPRGKSSNVPWPEFVITDDAF